MKEICRSIKVTDDVKPQSLSVLDQIRLLFSKMSNSDVAELDTNEKISAATSQRRSALTKLFKNAIEETTRRNYKSVTLEVSSEFLPYLDDVIGESSTLGKFYDFEVYKKNIPINVKHLFLVRISKRSVS